MKRALGIGFVVAMAVACGSDDPADFAGNYSIALTARDNGCNFANWEEGNTAQNIPVTITQDGANASATVEGAAGAFLDVVLGSRVYQGGIDGNSAALDLIGTRSASEGNCAYTVNSTIDATLDGDVLTGTISYRAQTNNGTDCGELTGCRSFQEFNGTRPPQ